MKDKRFVDSNIWLYLLSDDAHKKVKAMELLEEGGTISTQTLTENANVCLRKFKLANSTVRKHLLMLVKYCKVVQINSNSVFEALYIAERYQYSFYDSLVIATALSNGCEVLFSEDLQHEQVIERKLKIINPFL